MTKRQSAAEPKRRTASRRRFSVANCVYSDFARSEEHTSELQSRLQLGCRLLLGKKMFGHKGQSGARTRTHSESWGATGRAASTDFARSAFGVRCVLASL